MKKSILTTLQASIQGEVLSNKEMTRYYSVDASSYQIVPELVVIPQNELDVIVTIKTAKKFKTSVTVRGAGTGLVGSALNKGIILDMKNFNYCQIHKTHAIVGPGISKGKLDKELKKEGKFFPPNPSIGSFCSVGGMLGNNSSGSRSLKYGSVIDNVSEVTFIDGKGEKITLPKNEKISKKILKISENIDEKKFPKVTKNSSGYMINKVRGIKESQKLIIGSEGTLGIILSVKLKIKDIPKNKILFVIEYKSTKELSENCLEIYKTNPSAIEFVDKVTLNEIKTKFDKATKCLLFVEYDNNIKSSKEKIKSISTGKINQELKKDSEISRWWKYRDSSLHYSLKLLKKQNMIPHVIEDAAVPLEKLPELFVILHKINEKYNTKSITYGHAGNGNIHIRLVSEQKKNMNIKNIAVDYFNQVIKLGGTITAEHGDGLARSEFIKKQYGIKNYKIFMKIKRMFDPKNVLNPGKIISEESTITKNLSFK